MRQLACLATAAVMGVLLAGCDSSSNPAQAPVVGSAPTASAVASSAPVHARYVVPYPDRTTYKGPESDQRVDACGALPGATRDADAQSNPPHSWVMFYGTP